MNKTNSFNVMAMAISMMMDMMPRAWSLAANSLERMS